MRHCVLSYYVTGTKDFHRVNIGVARPRVWPVSSGPTKSPKINKWELPITRGCVPVGSRSRLAHSARRHTRRAGLDSIFIPANWRLSVEKTGEGIREVCFLVDLYRSGILIIDNIPKLPPLSCADQNRALSTQGLLFIRDKVTFSEFMNSSFFISRIKNFLSL